MSSNPNQFKIEYAYEFLDRFIELSKSNSEKHPYIVVILMHEYFRNIWPNDPFITDVLSKDRLENIILCLQKCISCLEHTAFLGSYFNSKDDLFQIHKSISEDNESESHPTQTVYGKLWKELQEKYVQNESKDVLTNLFSKNGFNVSGLEGKNVLDMGCGSGRFSLGFAQLGVNMITGVDLGKTGIDVGKKTAEKLGLKNIKFEHSSVLELPFDDNSFDFVFSKGVLHHTGDLKKGLNEYYRVLKKGGNGFLYIYGSGGLFWNSRKKMREVMKNIPMNYTQKILEIIGMPSKRYVFADSWYVPIEEHVSRKWLEEYLSELGFSQIKRVDDTGDKTIDSMANQPHSEELWGDGELRYFLTK